MSGGKKPDWDLRVKLKDEQNSISDVVGAGWTVEHGGISLRLNVGTILDWKDNIWIIVTPRDKKPKPE